MLHNTIAIFFCCTAKLNCLEKRDQNNKYAVLKGMLLTWKHKLYRHNKDIALTVKIEEKKVIPLLYPYHCIIYIYNKYVARVNKEWNCQRKYGGGGYRISVIFGSGVQYNESNICIGLCKTLGL